MTYIHDMYYTALFISPGTILTKHTNLELCVERRI